MSTREGSAIVWGLALVLGLTGCSGSDDDLDPGADAYRLQPLIYGLSNSEPNLDLGDPDAILLGALAAVTLGNLITVGDISAIDTGSPVGQRELFCDAGSVIEAVSTTGGGRNLSLDSDQCYSNELQSVQDGVLALSYSQPFAGEVEGSLSFGFGAESLLFSAEADVLLADLVDVVQLKGNVDFEGDADGLPGIATVSGLQVFIGRGPRPGAGNLLQTNRRIEVLGGGISAAFTADTAQVGALRDLVIDGQVSIEGSGSALDQACAVTGRYSVTTLVPPLLSNGDSSDELPRSGELQLSTNAGSARVEFDGDGNAQVTTVFGQVAVYLAAEVANYCGL